MTSTIFLKMANVKPNKLSQYFRIFQNKSTWMKTSLFFYLVIWGINELYKLNENTVKLKQLTSHVKCALTKSFPFP
jgi:hypothetical protein